MRALPAARMAPGRQGIRQCCGRTGVWREVGDESRETRETEVAALTLAETGSSERLWRRATTSAL